MRPITCLAETNGAAAWAFAGTAGGGEPGLDAEEPSLDRWLRRYDVAAARRLADAHVHLVVGMAGACGGHRLPEEDIIGEGFVAMMRAICQFDPDRGGDLATYIVSEVQAAVWSYVLARPGDREDAASASEFHSGR